MSRNDQDKPGQGDPGNENAPSRAGDGGSEHKQLVAVSEQFQGPLPHPSVLERYEGLLPGAADRIFVRFEEESKHRHEMDRQVTEAALHRSAATSREIRLGQWLGFILSMTLVIAGAVVAVLIHDARALFLSAGGLAMIVSAFVVHRKQKQRRSDEEE